MLKVGITGGIGSGKSTVCRVFSTLGIPVFNADDAAKYLMNNDTSLVAAIKALFGDDIYKNGHLDNTVLSTIVFKQPEKLQQLNALVHPATIQYAADWMQEQIAPYTIKEAAIFFESGSYKEMDVMIGVSAPPELRISRAMQSLNKTREEVLQRIAQQMDETEKMKRCDYIIINDEQTAIIPQVLELHKTFLQKSK
jgi:dephospho-CoA kinase